MSAMTVTLERRSSSSRRKKMDLALWGSGTVLAISLAMALFGAVVFPDTTVGDASQRLLGFGTGGHVLGTDSQGRDVLQRLIAGAGPSLLAGIAPMAIATVAGVLLGIFAGLAGKVAHSVIMRTLDIFYAFPAVLLAIAIAAAMGQSIASIVIALTVVMVPPIARVAEVETMRVRNMEFIESAIASGANRWTIATQQILPCILAPILVYATSLIGLSIIYAAGLSFLGLGAAPPSPEWGLMINELKSSIFSRPELTLVPALAITVVAAAFNTFGNALARRLNAQGAAS